jgi:hypothetical protein
MRTPLLALAAGAIVLAGCGSSSPTDTTPPPVPAPSAPIQDFPSARGKSLQDLRARLQEGPVLAPSVSVLAPGTNRVGFALFDRARKQISGAPVAVYTSRPDGTGVRGPYVARSESLKVKPQFQSRTTAQDPDAAGSVYVADVPFSRRGQWVVTGLARLDGRLVATSAQGMLVGVRGAQPPKVGERAIRVHTPTVASVSGDVSKIDTRVPPAADLHQVDFADVLGKKPVVLIFATPQLCQSRVCGPVVDVVEQVKSQVGDRVAFVHQEIYRNNDVSKGFRPQVAAWRLPTEPWTFVIDSGGRVSARFEGAISVGELARAVAGVQ